MASTGIKKGTIVFDEYIHRNEKTGFMVGFAWDMRKGDKKRIKVTSQGKLHDPKPWNQYVISYRDKIHPHYGASCEILTVDRMLDVSVGKNNACRLLKALFGCEDAVAQTMTAHYINTKKLDGNWNRSFVDFKKEMIELYPSLAELAGSGEMKESAMTKLSKFWAPSDIDDIKFYVKSEELLEMLEENPLQFMIPRTPFGLQQLPLDKKADWLSLTKKKEFIPNSERIIVSADKLFKNLRDSRALSAIHEGEFDSTVMHALKNGKVMFRWDAISLRKLDSMITERLTTKSSLPINVSANKLVEKHLRPEQKAALNSCFKYRITATIGAPGTGKSNVSAALIGCLNKKSVLVVSIASLVAKHFRFKYDKLCEKLQLNSAQVRAENFSQVITWIKNHTKEGENLASNIRVLVLEEATQFTYEMVIYLLDSLPNVVSMVMAGDTYQLGPIDPEPSFFSAFVMKYQGTPLVRELKEIVRTTDRLMISSMNDLREKKTENLLVVEDPSLETFCLVKRLNTVEESVKRIMETSKSLNLLGEGPAEEFLVITQKNDYVEKFNRAIFEYRYPEIQYDAADIRVGERILIKKNFTYNAYVLRQLGQEPEYEELIPSDLENGMRYTIERIVDYPIGKDAKTMSNVEVASTKADSSFSHDNYRRMVFLSDDKKINLSLFTEFTRGDCVTVYSIQGSEAKFCWFYLDKNFSHTLRWCEVYVAATRATDRTVIEASKEELDLVISRDNPEDPSAIADALIPFSNEAMYQTNEYVKHGAEEEDSNKKRKKGSSKSKKKRKTEEEE
jgi:hypothetical protein